LEEKFLLQSEAPQGIDNQRIDANGGPNKIALESSRTMKEFSPEELKEYCGKEDKPSYVVYDGKVYDVSDSKLWKGGQHMRRHQAGADLTTDIQAAPHGPEVLERYPQVGILKKAEADEPGTPLPGLIGLLLEKNPFFRRHPHPMTVHFPIVFMLAAPFFLALYLLTGVRAFETTAFHCLGGGALFTIVGITTGLITWWYNYMGRMMKPIAVKLPLSIVMLTLCTIAFIWRFNAPDLMVDLQGIRLLYPMMVLALAPLVSIIGWYGATMTFPIDKD
jgi:predicted heme/steroid binding protein/uncharacterized membrane protein